MSAFVHNGSLGIFQNGYWGHPAYKLPAEINLIAVSHYLDALAWQREAAKLLAIFGGKNPHPNFLVGGVPVAVSEPDKEDLARFGEAGTILNAATLERVSQLIDDMQRFVDQVYVPDTLAIAGFDKDWFSQGEGLGNFMSYGEFREPGGHGELIPRGVILDRNLAEIHPVDLDDEDQVQEYVAHSWYDYSAGKTGGLHPYDGETRLQYDGPKPPYRELAVDETYSWLKAPRWRGKAMEVGPLARVLLLYATGHAQTRELVDYTLRHLGACPSALFSTLGRTAARTLETKIIAGRMRGWFEELRANIAGGDVDTFNDRLWDPAAWPAHARGVGAWKRHAVLSPIGSLSRTAALPTTRLSFPPLGMPARAMRKDRRALTKWRWQGMRSPSPVSRSKCSVRSTVSTLASRAPCICSMRRGKAMTSRWCEELPSAALNWPPAAAPETETNRGEDL